MSGLPTKPPSIESNIFNPSFYRNANEVVDLETLNAIYVRKDDPANNALSGVTAGQASANKALLVDASRSISNIGALRSSLVGVGDALPSTLSQDITIMESSSTPSIRLGRSETTSNAFNVNYVHNGNGSLLNRLSIASFGATSANSIHLTANGNLGIGTETPSQKLEVLGSVNISNGSSYMIAGSSIDSRYLRTDADSTSTVRLRLYSTAAAGGSQTILQMGHQTAANDWFIRHVRGTDPVNSTLDLLNTNSNLHGLSIGVMNGLSNSDGAALTINSVSGNSTFISASSASANGTVHINGGVSRSVGSGHRLISTGAGTWTATSNILVSLFCLNNVWSSGYYVSSDRRLKEGIEDIETSVALRLLRVKPKRFRFKNNPRGAPVVGLIAQDLVREGLNDLTHLMRCEEVKERDEEFDLEADETLVVSYDKISVYLLEIVKQQQKQIEELTTRVDSLESVVSFLHT